MTEERYEADEGTPSQQVLDQQQAVQSAYGEADRRGRLSFAAGEVLSRQQEGGDPEQARILLGQLDDLARYPADETAAQEVYGEYRKYVRGAGQPAPAAAAGTQPAPKQTQPPHPQTAASRRSDNAMLKNPNTPVSKLIEIRERQKAGG